MMARGVHGCVLSIWIPTQNKEVLSQLTEAEYEDGEFVDDDEQGMDF